MTAQETDFILIDGIRHELLTNPLEAYRNMYRRDMVFSQDSPNTGCWRGYVAEWEIDEGKLFLLKVNGHVSYRGELSEPRSKIDELRGWDFDLLKNRVSATLSELFGPVNYRVPATWYTGELRVPHGEMIEYIHHSYASRYSGYLLIPVKSGVCGEQIYVNDNEYEEGQYDLGPY
jgi:hypothetical protein